MSLTAAGATALSAGITAAASLGAAGVNYAASQGMTAKARKENYMYNEMAAEKAFERQKLLQGYLNSLQRNNYYDLESPKAIIKQLREAGLSPSIYANGALGGGISGMSTAGAAPQGNGAAGLQPQFTPISPMDIAAINLANAQADKAKEEANTIRGDNERGQAEIENIIAQTLGERAKAEYTLVNTKLAEIDVLVKGETKDDTINRIHYESEIARENAEKLSYEIIKSHAEAKVSDATIQDAIDKIRNENKLLKADELFRHSQIDMNEAEITRINNECQKWQEELLQNWYKVFTDKQNANNYETYVNNLDDFQDDQIRNLKARLNMDKDHFYRKQRLEYIKLIQTMYDNSLNRLTDIICNVLPFSK